MAGVRHHSNCSSDHLDAGKKAGNHNRLVNTLIEKTEKHL